MQSRKIKTILGMLTVSMLLVSGCGNAQMAENATNKNEEVTTMSETQEKESQAKDSIAEAIAQETSKVDESAVEASKDEKRVPTAEIGEKIPIKYTAIRKEESGTIEKISYQSKDYFGEGGPVTKQANVYLPYGYDASKKYNVLYLMHGIGGDENEWGMTGNLSRVKLIMDNLAYFGDIESFIVVTPNGRSAENHAANGSDFNSFYCFGQELRHDLIPYIESHYSTYASESLATAGLDAIHTDSKTDEAAYESQKEKADAAAVNKALQDSRDHRAMAGLSMGGMQTINIGIGECVDLFSYYGAFSAAPTSNTASKTADILKDNTLPIHYFYNICGTEDDIAYASSSAAAKNLPSACDQFVAGENFMWQELPGAHDFNIWYLGFYNFAQIAFK